MIENVFQNLLERFIKNTINSILKSEIYIFGSRLDDNKKGGDIDIFVQTEQIVSLKEQIKILTGFEIEI